MVVCLFRVSEEQINLTLVAWKGLLPKSIAGETLGGTNILVIFWATVMS